MKKVDGYCVCGLEVATLLGRRFIVRTDQQSLRKLLEQHVIDLQYQKWVVKLLGYEFDIVYKLGKHNLAAGALSRKDVECGVMGGPQWRQWDVVRNEVSNDIVFGKIMTGLTKGLEEYKGFELRQQLLWYKDRLVLPKSSASILEEFHRSSMGGHLGMERTFQKVAAKLFWPGMRSDIKEFVRNCEVCQRNKVLGGSSAGLLQPILLTLKVWDEITMDFIDGLPKSKGCSVIMVFVDRLSKYAHFAPLKHPFDATIVADVFVKEVVKLHGIPQVIISDQDKVITMLTFKVLYGLEPPTISKYEEGSTRDQSVEEMLRERNVFIDELQIQLMKAQQRMKDQANKHRVDREFKVGELVFLKLQPIIKNRCILG
ncbi:hypothetical protein OSB04_002873 [Centaurea solstitialis]|uniref:Integrase catalytic domain-containing protein n=1 Tax=Centaurea solstitialis TaxID=347529 RepID=A0AA38UB91_9ASTR|nr:hypothetical protein OSB04_002873 [Centaurea solstitialis]